MNQTIMENEKIKLMELMAIVAERTMRFDFTVWFWGDSIAFDGMLDAMELLQDDKYQKHMEKFIARWVKKDGIIWNDALCPGVALIRLFETTGKSEYLQRAEQLADHLHNKVPRSYKPEGPLYLPDDPRYRNFLWVDSIYHIPPFFCYLAKATNKAHYFDWGMYALKTHVDCLKDKETYLFPQSRFMCTDLLRGYGWGRGIGWALLGMIDMYEMLPEGSTYREYVREQIVPLANVVLSYQDNTGCWRNLIHNREAPLEASTAAFFGAAFLKGIRLGILSEEFNESADSAWNFVVNHIDGEGGFYNVSACSWSSENPGDDTDRYLRFYTEVNVWGQGSALRIIEERIKKQTALIV